MNRNANLLCFMIIALIATFAACKHDIPIDSTIPPVTVPGGGGGGGGGTGSNLVCFETDILPIFQTNCAKASCHDAAAPKS